MVSAVVGVFTVVRGQSFAGHALTDASATGGSGSVLIGVNPLLGFVVGSVAGAGAMEAVGVSTCGDGTWPPASCSAPRSAWPHCSST